MARPKPFAISNRTSIPDSVRRVGVNSFANKGYYREYFNQSLYESAQEHVLGIESQVKTNNDATVWYDDTAGLFKDSADATVTLQDFDRVAMITVTADQDIDFPAGKEIVFVPYDEVDLDSNTLNLAGSYSGELRVNNGSVVITGTSHGLRINGTATVNVSGATGAILVNGEIEKATLNSPIINSATLKGTIIPDASVELDGVIPIGVMWADGAGSYTKKAGAIASISRSGTGTYLVTMDAIYSATLVFPVATILGSSSNYGFVTVLTGTGLFTVYTRDSAGALADRQFAIAVYSAG